MRLSTVFHSQTNKQMEQMNQKLEQYLRFFKEYRQKNQLEWLVTVEFEMDNKVHSATKILSFIANYGRELRIGADIRRKGKVEKVTDFTERIKKIQEKVGVALKKAQEETKKQADREQRKVEE